MALDDLLAKLECTPALSQSGVAGVSGVQASNGAGCGCNPSEIDGVSRVSVSTATGAPDTPDTPAEIVGYQVEPLPVLECTPDTSDTPQNDKGEATTARAWLLHFADRDPLEVWFVPPATHAEALAGYPEAIAAEPLALIEPQPLAAARGCKHCRHRARPGHAEPGYCARRTDQPHAYGPGHPLRLLSADGGTACEWWAGWR